MVRASKEKKAVLITGDANLCAQKWNEEGFRYKPLATELKSTIAQCGLTNIEMGMTYIDGSRAVVV